MSADEVKSFCDETYYEFDHLGDYIWKFNQQIDELRKIEIAKLHAYHADEPEMQAIRWARESQKLDYSFPTALNYSFVVLVFITIETRLMRTCDLIYELRKLPIRAKDLSGRGLERYMKFLSKLADVRRENLSYWPQISNLTKIRNCIVHTSGFLDYSRDAQDLRRLVEDKSYFTSEHRKRLENIERSERKSIPPALHIEHVAGGERLIVEMEYSHAVCAYGREFLFEVFEEAGLVQT